MPGYCEDSKIIRRRPHVTSAVNYEQTWITQGDSQLTSDSPIHFDNVVSHCIRFYH